MGRYNRLLPGGMSPEQEALYRAILSGKRGAEQRAYKIIDDEGALQGPFNVFLAHPALGLQLQGVGELLRHSTRLTPRAREIAILMIGADWRSEFEWYAHSAVARGLGIPSDVIEALKRGGDPGLTDPAEAMVFELCGRLIAREPVDDDLYRRAEREFGASGIVEIVSLFGYYTLIAGLLDVFRCPLPDGAEPAFSDGAAYQNGRNGRRQPLMA